jgi:hypothetical protein
VLGKIVATRLRGSQISRSSARTKPSTTYLLKTWCICSFPLSLQRSKAELARSRGTSAWRACARRRYVPVPASSLSLDPHLRTPVPLLYRQQGFSKFVSDIELYEIASTSERELYGKNASAIADPARRRETKIQQYKAEKDIRSRIEVGNSSPSVVMPNSTPRSLRNGNTSPSRSPTPPRQTLTSSQRCYRILRQQVP